jgi:hypothetical protein
MTAAQWHNEPISSAAVDTYHYGSSGTYLPVKE